jgi:DNA repair exonuclease SbcCD ATPase subunit
MIIFTTLSYCNFLSVGDTEITVNLNDTRSTLIVGHNGSGKSLMLDALSFVLFGKPHRNINKPQLVNSINGKNCLVTVEFKMGPSHYKIIRGLKPNIFEIWQNGILVNQESHSRDYQKLLEMNILKLNHKSFHQVVVLGSSNFIPFMQLSTHNRREVIEDLLDIGVFSKMNVVLKENVAKLKDNLKDTESQIFTTKEKTELQKKHISHLQQLNESNAAKYVDEIDALRENISAMTAENLTIGTEYSDAYGKTQQQLQRHEKTKVSLLSYERQIKDNIKKIVSDSQFYENHTECPTCNQNIGDDIREHKISQCKHSAQELNSGYEKLKESLTQTSDSVQEATRELQRLNKLHNKIHSNQNLVIGFEKRISDLTILMNTHHETSETSEAQQALDSLYLERDTLQELKSTQLEERMYNEVIAELLKDTGIKTKIIRQYLPVMNKLINHYLQTLDFFVSFNLDENFTETIKSRHRDDFSYSSFSEGEKSRINLGLLFAWRQVAKMKNSSNTNLLILDEVFDSSMDSEGVDNLLKIMATLDDNINIFVVTHKPDSFEGAFNRKIIASKKGNFTSYETQLLK